MKRTTELIAEPGERVEVRDNSEPLAVNGWVAGVVVKVETVYTVATDYGTYYDWSAEDVRKPQAAPEQGETQ